MYRSPKHLLQRITMGVLAACPLTLFAASVSAATPAPASSTAQQSPFYCDQGALTPVERARHFKVLGPTLAAKRLGVRSLPDGYEFEFSSDPTTYGEIVEWVGAERACCPFFDMAVRVTPERGPIVLKLTGRPGTKQFIEADGGTWLTPVRDPG